MAVRDNFASEEAYRTAFDATRQSGSDNKQTADVMLGITQVLSQRWLLQANYGLSSVNGYLTDPTKCSVWWITMASLRISCMKAAPMLA